MAASAPGWTWSQSAILSVPATDRRRVALAFERRSDWLAELLGRFGLAPADVAERLTLSTDEIARLLAEAQLVPALMLDGEDAARGSIEEVADALADALIGHPGAPWPLRFIRLAAGAAGLQQLDRIGHALARTDATAAPHSVVLPKVHAREDVEAALEALTGFERRLGADQVVSIHLLIESPAALARVGDLAEAAGARLAGLLFGGLDYAAEAGLPDAADHEGATLAWARAKIVNAAAAAGVPAIDGMTLRFPAPSRGGAADGEEFLAAVAATYEDTLRAARQGMAGKLVGHPAQWLAVLLGFGQVYSRGAQQRWTAIIDAYSAGEGGAMFHDGQMVDAASVSHARAMLARAAAAGYGPRGGVSREAEAAT